MEHWRDYRQVFEYTEFICVPRPGDDRAKVEDKIRQFRREYQKEILLSTAVGPNISSTGVREAICQNRSTDGMLLPEIRDYIERMQLYAEE